jgi:hypothetical protein
MTSGTDLYLYRIEVGVAGRTLCILVLSQVSAAYVSRKYLQIIDTRDSDQFVNLCVCTLPNVKCGNWTSVDLFGKSSIAQCIIPRESGMP